MDRRADILSKLASAHERNDEALNIALAEEIVAGQDQGAVEVLVEALTTASTAVRNDAIKVLYEVGARNPSLIADHADVFILLLQSKNNRLQWGAMTALAAITPMVPARIRAGLPEILTAAEAGSVITRDNAVQVLIQLCELDRYAADAFPPLLDQLRTAPTNQLPMYAERATVIAEGPRREPFIEVLQGRLDAIPQESKRKRVEKVIQRLVRST